MQFIISQIVVLFALVIIIFSILSKQKKNILFYRIPYAIFYAISFALQGRWVPFGNMLYSCTRSIVFYIFKNKNKKPNIYVLIIFIIVLLIVDYVLWSGPLDFLSMGTALLLVWTFWQDNEKVIRITVLFATTSMIIYNSLVLNYMGIVIESFMQILQVIAFVRYDILKKESLIKEPFKK